ncbi:MAG: PAS domain-containing protein [Deltaproteobacteria bacterium]|nr:PAS domain-containing protein [Candidatus Anaeroferrophillacea bacterium]
MREKRFLYQLYLIYAMVAGASFLAVTWYASVTLKTFYTHHIRDDLRVRAQLLAAEIDDRLSPAHAAALDDLCKRIFRETGTRLTVIMKDGDVLAESYIEPDLMDSHRDRPEVAAALAGGEGMAVRRSNTVHQTLMYVALPVVADGQVRAVVRAALSVDAIGRPLRLMYAEIAVGFLAITVIGLLFQWLVIRRRNRPLEEMKRGAELFARGNLGFRLRLPDSRELAGLARALNQMAGQLDDRIRTISNQRQELEAVLGSMAEGVLAFDNEERLLNLNRAASELLGIDAAAQRGRHLQEVIRNADLQQFVVGLLGGSDEGERDIVLHHRGERLLRLHGTVLRDIGGRHIGVLVVLNDVTRLRLLEIMRRDFVANVSHELKTPITSIKGFVETLLDDSACREPDEDRRFLQIIARQADRLNAIIDDLLSLSRLEQETDGRAVMRSGPLRGVIASAVQTCKVVSDSREIIVALEIEDEPRAAVNPALLEQALINLIDNAVKYSESGTRVEVAARRVDAEIRIAVIDQGRGIEKQHLGRIFERFYRVDKARSRQLGGTGLGLAIVKHIVQLHGGRVTVDSAPGRGSTFAIYLPAAAESGATVTMT